MLVRLFPNELLCLENNSTTNNINDTFLILWLDQTVTVSYQSPGCVWKGQWVTREHADSVRLLECIVCTIVTSINGQRHQRYRISQVTFASVNWISQLPLWEELELVSKTSQFSQFKLTSLTN